MRNEKGQWIGSGNPAGRPAGVPNKITGKMREQISEFLETTFPQIQADFKDLRPATRVKMWIELLQFAIPRLSTLQVDEFDKLTDEQLEALTKKVLDEAVKTTAD